MTGYQDDREADSSFRMTTPPRDQIWGVVATLGILAVAGAFLGFQNVRSGDIMPTGWVPGSAPAANVAGAVPAVAMPKDEKWSTLNGPQVLGPAAQRPARATHRTDDDPADSAAPMPDPNVADGPILDSPPPASDGKTASPLAGAAPQP